MEKGNLIERRLESVVFNELSKVGKNIIMGAGIGCDYSRVDGMIVSDGNSEIPEIAWIKAVNNFNCSLGKAVGARLNILVPLDTKESYIRKCMQTFASLSDKSGISIIGGNTRIVSGVNRAQFSVQIIGSSTAWTVDKRSVLPNMSIIMCGYAGMLGTDMLIAENKAIIDERFGNNLVGATGCVFGVDGWNTGKAARTIAEIIEGGEVKVSYIHDVSEGGVYTALWQLGRWANSGLKVTNSRIPIVQQTIEVCELLDMNPYLIDGSGALLIVCDNAEEALRILEKQGVIGAIIGRISDSKERKVTFGEEESRTLAAFEGLN